MKALAVVIIFFIFLCPGISCSTAKQSSDIGLEICVEEMAGVYVDISRNGRYELKLYPDSTFGYQSHIGELGGDECAGKWEICRDTINFYIVPDTLFYRFLVAIKYLDTLPSAKIISKDRLKINFSRENTVDFNPDGNELIRPNVYNDNILILNREQ